MYISYISLRFYEEYRGERGESKIDLETKWNLDGATVAYNRKIFKKKLYG